MKRFLSALLVLALSFGLVACNSDVKEDIYNNDTEANNALEEVSDNETDEVAKIAE